jgi:hypothetical protein
MSSRFYNDAGNVVVSTLAVSSGNDDAMVFVCGEQIRNLSPPGHTIVPVQCVRGNLAALPHRFQLHFLIRPAPSALHVHVYIHGCRLLRENRKRVRLNSKPGAILVASIGKFVQETVDDICDGIWCSILYTCRVPALTDCSGRFGRAA